MDDYGRIARRLRRELAPMDRARSATLRRSQDLVRSSSRLIRDLHRGTWDKAEATRLESAAEDLRAAARAHPFLAHHGALQQAFGEYAEAHLLRAFVRGAPPPDPAQLKIPAGAWLLGLADLVGELRRIVLARLVEGDTAAAQRAFGSMEKVYESLQDSEAPEGIVPLRHKLDTARSLLERTRGDLVTGKRAKELEKKIDGVSRLLDEAEGSPVKRAKRKDADDLDLDSAWNRD